MQRLLVLLLCMFSLARSAESPRSAPLFRDFTGLVGHTVKFDPVLYKPVCRLVRDYHPVDWDLGTDTSVLPEWPFAKNRVSWEKVYGSWHAQGLRTSACLIFDNFLTNRWKNLEADAGAYAESFARQFGPGGRWPFVETIEIGNEPGLFPDDVYLRLHNAMARGIRKANPRIQIATCNVEAGKSDRYWKGADLFRDHLDLVDVLRIHRYAIKEQWPVWRRTHPEDTTVPYLRSIQELLHWRDRHAPGKQVWVSEFGWDCSTQKPDPKGEWAKWVGSSDEDQARWLVRSFLIFARMGLDRAYVYYFNDDDKPQLHACSGLTRNFKPKPSYHAIAWMLDRLADYRFDGVVQESAEDGYVYRLTPADGGPLVHAVWHPTLDGKAHWQVPADLGVILKAERMPLAPGAVAALQLDGRRIPMGIDPVLVWTQP